MFLNQERSEYMKKKACLIGINDYAPVGPGGPDLRGCVNDVRDVAHTLNALGIVPAVPASMRIVTDARATRAVILDGLKWLITGVKKGDVLVFYYSGHGSQVADVGGEEIDMRDETICPHDYATAGMIKDDDFRALLAGLPAGVNMDIILDSCHSGTGTREIAALSTVPEEQTVTYRYIEPPIDWGYFLDANPSLPVRGLFKPEGGKGMRAAVIVPGLNHVLWAGCRDNQTSAEAPIGGVVRGAFTYCFCLALRRAGVLVTRRRLDALVSADLSRMGYSQVPQLEGTNVSLGERVFT
jgi:metacaspase-1